MDLINIVEKKPTKNIEEKENNAAKDFGSKRKLNYHDFGKITYLRSKAHLNSKISSIL